MTRNLLSLVAIGGCLAAAPAAALELGDVSTQSTLGQPLRASIAYALAPSEMLSSSCVTVSTGHSTGGLPGIGQATVTIAERAILISSQAVVHEPLIGARVTINCPYTPKLSREYMLFVDPSPIREARPASSPAAQPEAPAPRPVVAAQPANSARPGKLPIGQSTNYQVQPGDTLSGIARRIESQAVSRRMAVNAIFAANPDAFIGEDRNRLKAGAWLTIPSFDATAPVNSPAAEPADSKPATVEPEAATTPDNATASVYEPLPAALTDTTADLKPGDIVYEHGAAEPGETTVGPVTETEETPTAVNSSAVPTAVVSTGARRESTSLLAWLIGGSLAIIGTLAFFARRFRKGSGPTPKAAAANPSAAAEDNPVTAAANYDIGDDLPTEEYPVKAAASCDIDDDAPTQENLALDGNLELDADLELGTGFDMDTGIDVEEVDFGVIDTTKLDIELPFEPVAAASADTDIIPPININVESILESEVLPEDDDYDMSVIVDATKMPQPEEVTERDLQAVEVGARDDSMITGTYLVSSEVDYDILEQDYEDQLTATQALNEEIERAAAEIAREFGAKSEDPAPVLPKESFPELDGTAELRVANDDETVEADTEGGKLNTKRLG